MDKDHMIELDEVILPGTLMTPESAAGLVLFAHGSGSSRHSPRNRKVAEVLHEADMATLLIDLLTGEEDEDPAARFDIALLTKRLIAVTQWVKDQPAIAALPLGYFGASTGAASALGAAAELPGTVKAIVSRGGRPDLAEPALPLVRSATLLIVGGWDEPVIAMNRSAFEQLRCTKHMVIVPEATHLFEEPGKLDVVAKLATAWFTEYLVPG